MSSRQSTYSDDSILEPSIEPRIHDAEGTPVDRWTLARDAAGDGAVKRIKALQKTTSTVLEGLAITTLSAVEARKPVPGLRAEGGVLAGEECTGSPVSVKDALFFSTLD